MKKIKNWLSSSTKNKVIFSCGIVVLTAIICLGLFFIYKNETKHEHTVDYKYESLDDGTHKKISYCTDKDGKECKDFKSKTTTEKCKFDKDGICKYCEYCKYVTVKFTNNIDSKIIKEKKFEKGYTLDLEKDFPEAEEIEGYEFSRYDGNYTSLKDDTTITLVYNAISEENKEETSTNEANNIDSNNSSNKSNKTDTSASTNNTNTTSSAPVSNSTNNTTTNNNSENTSNETWNDGSGDEELPAEVLEQTRILTERRDELKQQVVSALSILSGEYHIQDCNFTEEYGPDNTYLILTLTTPDGEVRTTTLYPSK